MSEKILKKGDCCRLKLNFLVGRLELKRFVMVWGHQF